MDTPETTPPAPATPALVEIPLETPIRRGDTTISAIHLRKPGAGELRGLQMQPLLQGDVNALLALLPRITVPPLIGAEAEALSLADLGAVGGAVYGFFMSKAERSAMAKVMGAIDTELSSS